MCGWNNVANPADDFDWERAQAETTSYGTGPVVDHTLGTSSGKYRVVVAHGNH